METGDQLRFDEQGEALGSYGKGTFSSSAISIEEVNPSGTEVLLWCRRMGMGFRSGVTRSADNVQFFSLGDHVNISIALNPTDHEALETAIKKIFALSVRDALADKSDNEQQTILDSLGDAPGVTPPGFANRSTTNDPQVLLFKSVLHPGGGVLPPTLIYTVEPKYTADAKEKHFKGVFVVNLIVSPSGEPTDVHVVHSPYPGLDAEAVAAVRQYKFAPGTFRGKPVFEVINVEVNFLMN